MNARKYTPFQPLAAALLLLSSAAPTVADNVIADDLIVQGNACVGTPCADNWGFGNLELHIQSERPDMLFGDTSTSGTDRDWVLQANDDNFEFFLIYDDEAGTFPFFIDGGAPSNSLVVSSDGNLATGGYGSSAALHLTRGDTPQIRFEQDGSNGNTPHEWAVIANENNFYVRDRTNNTGPFYIYPGADNEGALTINGDGQIGVGTYTATQLLHVTDDDGAAQILVEETSATTSPRTLMNLQNTGRPEIVMGNTATNGEWSFGAGTNFILKQGAVGTDSAAKTKLFQVNANGDAILTGSLTTGGGTCGGGCDAVFTERAIIPAETYAARMWDNGHLPHVGPTPENAPINVSRKLGGMLNALEHAHVFIEQQRGRIAAQDAEIARLEAQLAGQTAALAEVLNRVSALETR